MRKKSRTRRRRKMVPGPSIYIYRNSTRIFQARNTMNIHACFSTKIPHPRKGDDETADMPYESDRKILKHKKEVLSY